MCFLSYHVKVEGGRGGEKKMSIGKGRGNKRVM